MPEAYPENVPGDFYVEKDCCTCCDVPRAEAPDLFTYAQEPDGYAHCYVSKQPSNSNELEDMLRVIQCAELQCIHYRGNDPAILKRISDVGESAVCDALNDTPFVVQRPVVQRPWWRFW